MPGLLLRPPVLAGGLVALLMLQIVAFAGVRNDDAFITYRYAQNLALGNGPVFNPTERLLGSTSPGHILIASVVYAIAGRDATPGIMSAIGCIAWSAQAVALFLLLRRALLPSGAAVVALAVLIGGTRAQNWVPLETNLVVACVLFAFAAAGRARWSITAGFAAAATLMRPDAWLPALILAGFCLYERRREVLPSARTFIVLAAPWPLFALYYYGSPVPQSAFAKFQRTELLEYVQHLFTYPSSIWLPLPVPAEPQVAVTFGLAGLGAWCLWRRSTRLAPFLIAGVAHALAYAYLRPFTVHGWHVYPWVLFVSVLAWSALVCIAQALAARGKRPLAIATSLAIAALLGVQGVRYAESIQTLARGYWTGERQAVYVDIARYLEEHASSGDWFGSIEVGTIAYYSDLPAFDLGGLVTRPTQRLDQSPVKFLVVDRLYMQPHAAVPPVFRSQHGEFVAVVYRTR